MRRICIKIKTKINRKELGALGRNKIAIFNRERIQEERIKRKLNYNDMAKLLNITVSGYIYKEHGHRAFKLEEICEISKHFNIPLEELIKVVEVEPDMKGGEN